MNMIQSLKESFPSARPAGSEALVVNGYYVYCSFTGQVVARSLTDDQDRSGLGSIADGVEVVAAALRALGRA